MKREDARSFSYFGHLRSEYVDALSDLFYALDAESALSQTLRRIVSMSGSGAAFIGLADTYDFENSGDGVVCAVTGDQFRRVESYAEMIAMVAAFGWSDPSLPFEGILPADKAQPERRLVGYPLIDQLGVPRGVLLVVVFTQKSVLLIEDLCALLVFLVMHRIQEFELIRRAKDQANETAAKILSGRGLCFPEVSTILNQIVHDVNGRLAVAGLQVQVFKEGELTAVARARGLDRLGEAISSVGALIAVEEEVIDLLLVGKETRPIKQSISLALQTFDIGLERRIPVVVDLGDEGGNALTFPGNVAYWMMHNVLRIAAVVLQSALSTPEAIRYASADLPGSSRMESDISLKLIPRGFLLRFPSNNGVTDMRDGFVGKDYVSRLGGPLPAVFSVLRETAFLCGLSTEFVTKANVSNVTIMFHDL